MTPDDARIRWCPFARVLIEEGARWKDGSKLPAGSNCLADKCMAWRWTWTPGQAANYARPPALGAALDRSYEPRKMVPDGYCGLAGAHGLG